MSHLPAPPSSRSSMSFKSPRVDTHDVPTNGWTVGVRGAPGVRSSPGNAASATGARRSRFHRSRLQRRARNTFLTAADVHLLTKRVPSRRQETRVQRPQSELAAGGWLGGKIAPSPVGIFKRFSQRGRRRWPKLSPGADKVACVLSIFTRSASAAAGYRHIDTFVHRRARRSDRIITPRVRLRRLRRHARRTAAGRPASPGSVCRPWNHAPGRNRATPRDHRAGQGRPLQPRAPRLCHRRQTLAVSSQPTAAPGPKHFSRCRRCAPADQARAIVATSNSGPALP